jgi:uncharacterized protein YkwD
MKTLIIFLMLYSSFYCFSQNLRTPEEVKYFNREFIRLINIERKKLNIDTLIESDKLTKASIDWSRECSIKNFFKHSELINGSAECLTYIYGKKQVNKSALESVQAFQISSPHWKILMDPEYKFIGTGEYLNITKNHIKDEGDIMPITKVASIVTIQLSR